MTQQREYRLKGFTCLDCGRACRYLSETHKCPDCGVRVCHECIDETEGICNECVRVRRRER